MIQFLVLLTLSSWLLDRTKPEDSYYLLAKGFKWMYEMNEGKEVVKEVGEATRVGEIDCWPLSHFGIVGVFDEDRVLISSDKDAVTIRKLSNLKYVLWFKFGVKKGDKWSCKGKIGDAGVTFDFEVAPDEEVKVAAGTYDCVKVVLSIKDDEGAAGTITTWYAKGVGEVKSEYTATDGKKKLEGSRSLKKFEK